MTHPHTLRIGPAAVAVVSALLPTLAAAAFSVRIYERRVKRNRLNIDDWFLSVGLFLLWVLAIICFVGVGIGALGQHSQPAPPWLPPDRTVLRGPADFKAEKIIRAYSIVEKLAFAVIKASLVLSYRRIFYAQPIVPKICVALLVLLGCQCLAFIIAAALQCQLKNWGLWWQSWAIANHCASAQMVWVGFSISDVATDVMILGLPIKPVWSLKLKTSKKVAAVVMFGCGLLSTAVGIARMAYLIDFTYSGKKGYRDLLGLQSDVLLLSIIEASVAIMAASVAALRSILFKCILDKLSPVWTRMTGAARSRNGSESDESDTILSDPESTKSDLEARPAPRHTRDKSLDFHEIEMKLQPLSLAYTRDC